MADAPSKSVSTIETGGSAATDALMSVKVEMAIGKTGGNGPVRSDEEKGVRNAIGGEEENEESIGEDGMLPNGTKRLGRQGLLRPDETKRPGGQTLPRGDNETDDSPSPDETKRFHDKTFPDKTFGERRG